MTNPPPSEPVVLDISDEPILQRGCPPDDDPDGQLQWCAAVTRMWIYRSLDQRWAVPGPHALTTFGKWLTSPEGPASWDWTGSHGG